MASAVKFGQARFGTFLFGEEVDIVDATVTDGIGVGHEGGAGAIFKSFFRGLLALTQNPGLHARARSNVSISDDLTQAAELYETISDDVVVSDAVCGQVTNRYVISGSRSG